MTGDQLIPSACARRGDRRGDRVLAAALVLATALGAAAPVGAVEPTGPVVATDLGPIRGVELDGAAAFRGVPFAAPPVGPLRWRPPQPATPWTGVRDATAFGANCLQPAIGDAKSEPQSEDCLTLNVITPDLHASKLPVLVSIHGGAFAFGSGRYLVDTGAAAIVRRGVVLVSPNYRLGWLGFFAHPAITRQAASEPVGNYWLMDQIAALKWVKANIARFGGDPDNVTILGCSAGGSSVESLVASPLARGLFDKASVHSGGGLFNATRSLALAEQQGAAFAAGFGVSGDGGDALAGLRALTAAQIVAVEQAGPPDFGAIIDGRLLPAPLPVLFARGQIARVPLILGSTSNEASVFGLMGFDKTVLADRFGVDIDALRPAYEHDGKLSDAELLRQVQTDFIFTAASLGVAGFASRTGQPTWTYHFDYVGEANAGKLAGAPHCADMPYLFDELKAPTARDRKVAQAMQAYLVNFLRRGDPNGEGLPAWPRYRPPHAETLVVRDTPRAMTDFRADQLAPWFDKAAAEAGESPPH
jgi:para-nitrobenzyl esterase